jgi:hypothetical protein
VAAHLEKDLTEWCLNPAKDFPEYQLFPRLKAAFTAFVRTGGKGSSRFVTTQIATEMFKALRHARRAKITLIDGLEGVGKSTAAKEWCHRNSAVARYVNVPATNDDLGFWRAIAKADSGRSAVTTADIVKAIKEDFKRDRRFADARAYSIITATPFSVASGR